VAAAILLFREMLGIATIGAGDDFLRCGGDSIAAVRLLSRVRRIFQVEMALPDFLDNRTPAALAARLAAMPGTEETARALLHLQGLSGEARAALARDAARS